MHIHKYWIKWTILKQNFFFSFFFGGGYLNVVLWPPLNGISFFFFTLSLHYVLCGGIAFFPMDKVMLL